MTWTGTLSDPAVAGHTPTGAEFLTWYNALVALTEAWESYTPTWTGGSPAIGNGTLSGHYIQSGKLVLFRIDLIAGSTTTFGSTAYTFGLPVASAQATGAPLGFASLNDSSVTTNRYGAWTAWQNGASSFALGDASAGRVSNTAPFTFANGDQIAVKGFYEAS